MAWGDCCSCVYFSSFCFILFEKAEKNNCLCHFARVGHTSTVALTKIARHCLFKVDRQHLLIFIICVVLNRREKNFPLLFVSIQLHFRWKSIISNFFFCDRSKLKQIWTWKELEVHSPTNLRTKENSYYFTASYCTYWPCLNRKSVFPIYIFIGKFQQLQCSLQPESDLSLKISSSVWLKCKCHSLKWWI